MNQYPAKPMMDQMAQHGRYGDSMLVHMNPVEVAGIASLSPTGSLTINPVTGQPEAFLPLLFGALGGAMGLGTLGTAALTGVGTAAVTGDLKRGLISGLTAGLASGLGEGIGSLFDSAPEVVDTANAATASAEVAAGAADAGTAALDASTAVADGVNLIEASAEVPMVGGPTTLSDIGPDGGPMPFTDITPQSTITRPPISTGVPDYVARTPNMSDAIFGRGEGIAQAGLGKLGGMGQFVAASTGQSMLEQMDVQEDFERAARDRMAEGERKRAEAYADLQSGYRAAQPEVMGGPSPYRSEMSRRTANYGLPGMYAAGGGQMPSMAEGGEVPGYFAGGTLKDLYKTIYDGLKASGDETVANLTFEQFLATFLQDGGAGTGTGTDTDGANTSANSEIYEQRIQELMDKGMTREEAIANQNNAIALGYDLNNDGAVFDKEYSKAKYIQETPLSQQIKPTEEEAAVLAYASTSQGTALYPGQQAILEGYYDRYERRRQIREGIGPKEEKVDISGIFNPATFGYLGQGLAGIDPVSIQQGLRGAYAVAPPRDHRAGFEREFSYFQDDPDAVYVGTRAYRPRAGGINQGQEQSPYFDPILERGKYNNRVAEYYRTLASYGLGTGPSTDPQDPTVDPSSDPDFTPTGPEHVGWYWNAPIGQSGGEWVKMYGGQVVSSIYTTSSGTTKPSSPPSWVSVGDPDVEVSPTPDPDVDPVATTTSTTTPTTNPTTTTATNPGTPSSGYVDPVQAALDYVPSAGEYAGAAQYGAIDPFLHGRRGMTPGKQFLAGSRQDVGMDDFLSALGQAKGKYGQGMTYDPARGLFSNISEEELARHREAQSVPFGVSPDQMTDTEQLRAKMMGNRQLLGKQQVAIGDRMYFLDDGNVSSYQYQDTPYESTPGFRAGGISNLSEEPKSAPPKRSGTVALKTPLGEVQTPAGGIAEVDNQFSATPSVEEIEILSQAVLGRGEDPEASDAIRAAFINKYGNEVFAMVREMILKSVMPNAQTEGMINGNGSGMDDKVPGMIGDQQPVAVSPGEFIVPADVVSDLGDGSSDSGADELYEMMSRVRRARGGNGDQPPAINARKSMPA